MLTSRCSFVALVSAVGFFCACSGDSFESVPGERAGSSGQSTQTTGGQAGSGGSAGQAGTGGVMGGSGGMAIAGSAGVSGGVGKAGGPASECAVEKEFSCLDDVLFVCIKGQREALQTCGAGLCDANKGNCLDCVPNSAIGCFNDTTQKICSSTGNGDSVLICPDFKPFCAGAGDCVECRDSSDCAASSKDCFTSSCIKGSCVEEKVQTNKEANTQVKNDCKKKVCDGSGKVISVADTSDIPLAQNECFTPSCSEMGEPQQLPIDAGTPCNGGGVCNGKGVCGSCIPGAVECASYGSRKTCDGMGMWETEEACGETAPACDNGECLSAKQVSAGYSHYCAVMSNGSIRCWGSNFVGQLGIGDNGFSSVLRPKPVLGVVNAQSVCLGGGHSCALDSEGKVWCWGYNGYGALGVGEIQGNYALSPVEVPYVKDVAQISCGNRSTCSLSKSGDIFCWGDNYAGQLGQDPLVAEIIKTPVALTLGKKAKKIAVGDSHACAISEEGDVYCWGSGGAGQLGDGKQNSNFIPQQSLNISNVIDIVSGGRHMIALLPSQLSGAKFDVWSWGSGSFGQNFTFDSPQDQAVPTQYVKKDLTPFFDAVFAGFSNSVVIVDGFSLAMGDNQGGQLATGNKENVKQYGSESPGGLSQVAVGDSSMCGLQSSGRVWCWGQNEFGQLGTGDTDEHLKPVQVKW